MASVTQVGQLKALMSYVPDGVAAALEGVLRYLPEDIKRADDLTLTVSNTATDAAVDTVSLTDGARPLFVAAVSKGQAGFVGLHAEAASGSASWSVDNIPDVLFPVATATDEVTSISLHGASYTRFWDAAEGIQLTSSSTNGPGTAMTSIPVIFVLTGKV